MNNIINKFLLAGDKFMPEMHLRQPQFTYSAACGPFTKHKQRIQKFKETGDTNFIYKNELDKACFAHDAAYSDSKDLTKRTAADKMCIFDKLDDIVDEYNNSYQTSIKMKPIDVKDNTYINTDKEINNKDPKFKVGDRERISKYKNIFAKGYTPDWSEEVFVIKKVKNTVPWTYVKILQTANCMINYLFRIFDHN